MVYFIRNHATGAIKIGTATDPDARLKQLQTATPDRLSILGVMHGGIGQERSLHRRFAGLRLAREWFRGTAELVSAIRSMATSPPAPQAVSAIPFLPCDIDAPDVVRKESEVGLLIGFFVDTYWGLEPVTTGSRLRPYSFQVMPAVDFIGPHPGGTFWDWHLDHHTQWFANPFLALDAFLSAWISWSGYRRRGR